MRIFMVFFFLLFAISIYADGYRTIQRNTTLNAKNGATHKIEDFGNYHALLIYVETYKYLNNLKTPKRDIEDVAKILKDRYGFIETQIVRNPTNSDDLIGILDGLKNRLNSDDNLLIYYAGHGSKNGYWQLSMAERNTRRGWISIKEAINQTLKEMRSRHVLVVSDSCYSGYLTRDGVGVDSLSPSDKKYYSKLYEMKSRNVLTSGGLQPVLDQDPNNSNHSVFANGFLRMLQKNSQAIFSFEEKYSKVKRYVQLNTEEQIPLYGDVKLTGHEDGGDFIFLDRKFMVGEDSGIEGEEYISLPLNKNHEPQMIHISKGSYTMGSNSGDSDEKPSHRVNIGYDFEIGKYEVSVGEFRKFVNDSNYETEAEIGGGCYVYSNGNWCEKSYLTWKNPYFKQNSNEPVVCISWNDATAYTKWLSQKTGKNYRLPTETEWEFVARAGIQGKWSFGDDKSSLKDYAWYLNNSRKTHKVGTKKPNLLGVYDMHGNVWEWCEDWYLDSYNSSSIDGSPNYFQLKNEKVVRGGSWISYAINTRSASRSRFNPSIRKYNIGFRLQRTLP